MRQSKAHASSTSARRVGARGGALSQQPAAATAAGAFVGPCSELGEGRWAVVGQKEGVVAGDGLTDGRGGASGEVSGRGGDASGGWNGLLLGRCRRRWRARDGALRGRDWDR